MGYLGYKPADKPLTAADITDSIITSAKIVDGSIVNADINASSAIAISKLSATGTANQVLRMNSGATALEFATVSGTTFGSALFHVRDEKSAGVDGGTNSTGSFLTRTLNTVMTNEISGASLATDKITLPAGTYFIYARIPAFNIDRHKSKLRNVTDSTDTLIGSNSYATPSNISVDSWIIGRFTIAGTKDFEIQYRNQTVNTSLGLGLGVGYSVVEVYTDVQIWKVA
jgi:hypothetical protein